MKIDAIERENMVTTGKNESCESKLHLLTQCLAMIPILQGRLCGQISSAAVLELELKKPYFSVLGYILYLLDGIFV